MPVASRSYLVVFICSLASACYASHGPAMDLSDAGQRDIPVDRGFERDAALEDVMTDLWASDIGLASCRFEFVARTDISWPSADCGSVQSPQVVALEGPRGPFELQVGEFRTCRDRPSWILARRLEVDTLWVGPEAQVSPGRRITSAAFGEIGGICEGNRLVTRSAGIQREFDIQVSPPGACTVCSGAAFDGSSWVAAQAQSDCDETAQRLTRIHADGSRDVFDSPGEVRSLITTSEGIAALTVSLDSAFLVSWPRNALRPDVFGLPIRAFSGQPIELAPWPFANAKYVLAVAGSASIQWVLLNSQVERVDEFEHALEEQVGFASESLKLVQAEFGVVAVLGESWTGGAIRARSQVIAIGRNGTLLGPVIQEEVESVSQLSVAARGEFVVVHTTPGQSARTHDSSEARIFRCR